LEFVERCPKAFGKINNFFISFHNMNIPAKTLNVKHVGAVGLENEKPPKESTAITAAMSFPSGPGPSYASPPAPTRVTNPAFCPKIPP
jgi:hypothetical protein